MSYTTPTDWDKECRKPDSVAPLTAAVIVGFLVLGFFVAGNKAGAKQDPIAEAQSQYTPSTYNEVGSGSIPLSFTPEPTQEAFLRKNKTIESAIASLAKEFTNASSEGRLLMYMKLSMQIEESENPKTREALRVVNKMFMELERNNPK